MSSMVERRHRDIVVLASKWKKSGSQHHVAHSRGAEYEDAWSRLDVDVSLLNGQG